MSVQTKKWWAEDHRVTSGAGETTVEKFRKIIKDHAEVIKQTILFQNIPPKDLSKFIVNCDYKEMEPGEIVFEKGDKSLFLAILLSGVVDIFREKEKLFTLQAPALIGEIGLFTGMNRNATAKAGGKAILLTIVQSKLDSLFGMDPKLSYQIHRNIILCLSNKINDDNQKIVSLVDALKQREKEMAEFRKKGGLAFEQQDLVSDNALMEQPRDPMKKRKHLRVPVPDPSFCYVKLQEHRIEVRDISPKGMRVKLSNLPETLKVKLVEGKPISGELCLKSGTFDFSGTIRILDTNSCGIKFDHFNENLEYAINEVISVLKKLTQVI